MATVENNVYIFDVFVVCCVAGAREGVFPGLVVDDPNNRGQTKPGYVAGHLAVRAQGPCGLPQAAHHIERLPAGLESLTYVPRQPDGQHEQLGKSLGALHRQTLTSVSDPEQ